MWLSGRGQGASLTFFVLGGFTQCSVIDALMAGTGCPHSGVNLLCGRLAQHGLTDTRRCHLDKNCALASRLGDSHTHAAGAVGVCEGEACEVPVPDG